jgi:hypothetical protein
VTASRKRRTRGNAHTVPAAVLVTLAAVAVPVAHAEPAHGTGDEWFISRIENSPTFSPTPPISAVRAIIPLAHQVCDARTNGQDDLQAAHLVWAGKGVDTLGVVNGSIIGEESVALDIVEIAEEAYCPQYATGNY